MFAAVCLWSSGRYVPWRNLITPITTPSPAASPKPTDHMRSVCVCVYMCDMETAILRLNYNIITGYH